MNRYDKSYNSLVIFINKIIFIILFSLVKRCLVKRCLVQILILFIFLQKNAHFLTTLEIIIYNIINYIYLGKSFSI